ncbi:hypothetical protein PIB30_066282 [Stylosanthes scabra]|uniref:Uncharacterized protein n=1 Tax=Stylosanthes scabra TaxID=79078 RepID=A0ABU6XNQ9_9FABA|nr:hypothetical protein [Stylosanthes scabra]
MLGMNRAFIPRLDKLFSHSWLCKEAGVPFREFRDTEFIPVFKPIAARVMMRTRGRNINYQQHEEEEDQLEPMQQDENEAENAYEDDNQEEQPYIHFEAPNADFQNTFQKQKQQGFQQLNEQLSNMNLQQMQFFENMQKTQAQYLEELKAFKTSQDELWSNQNNFYQRMRTQQGEMAKEIEEIKKFQVNQTLMGFRRDPLDKLEMRMDNQHKEIVKMRAQIKEWTKNASSREAYCCWEHQQANPNLVEIPTQKIPEFVHDNVAKGKHIFHGALKSHNQGEPSQHADPPNQEDLSQPADQPMEKTEKE